MHAPAFLQPLPHTQLSPSQAAQEAHSRHSKAKSKQMAETKRVEGHECTREQESVAREEQGRDQESERKQAPKRKQQAGAEAAKKKQRGKVKRAAEASAVTAEVASGGSSSSGKASASGKSVQGADETTGNVKVLWEWSKGARCEARWNGDVDWLPGRVARRHADGTLDITYVGGGSGNTPAELRERANLHNHP